MLVFFITSARERVKFDRFRAFSSGDRFWRFHSLRNGLKSDRFLSRMAGVTISFSRYFLSCLFSCMGYWHLSISGLSELRLCPGKFCSGVWERVVKVRRLKFCVRILLLCVLLAFGFAFDFSPDRFVWLPLSGGVSLGLCFFRVKVYYIVKQKLKNIRSFSCSNWLKAVQPRFLVIISHHAIRMGGHIYD